MRLDDQILNTYLDGELTEPWKSQVEEHLSYCSGCRARYQNLIGLSNAIKSAALSDEEIQPHQERVMAVLEKNYLKKKSKKSILHHQFKFSASQLVGVAAAFVVVFVGSWAVFGNNGGKDTTIPLPEVSTSIDLNNITQTRSSDNSTTSQSLETYSLDAFLKNLDARGYDVDIRLKSIQPLSLGKSSEVSVIATIKDKNIIITSDGLAKDSEGMIVATGVKLDADNQIVASDGTVIFNAEEVIVSEIEASAESATLQSK